MAAEATTLVIGRGELFFAPYDPAVPPGIGEVYIGNTPEFVTSRELERRDLLDSFDGQQVEVDSVITRENHTARFTTDHISVDNITLWYGGEQTTVVQNRIENLSETFVVTRGKYYQLGVTASQPFGVRAVDTIKITIGGSEIAEAGNFEVDKDNARIRILPDAADIANGSIAIVTYEKRDLSAISVEPAQKQLIGSLRFVSRNPVGVNKNIFYPLVVLTPSGEIDHKSNDWQRISFSAKARRRSPIYSYVYVDETQSVGYTIVEHGIIVEGGITVSAFPYWEDLLDQITNVTIPSHNY